MMAQRPSTFCSAAFLNGTLSFAHAFSTGLKSRLQGGRQSYRHVCRPTSANGLNQQNIDLNSRAIQSPRITL